MNVEKNIGTAFEHLSAKQLDEAIKVLQPIYDGKPSLADYDKFIAIANDYNLMCDYMLRGFKDPAREGLYNSLLERLYKVTANLLLSWNCKNKPTFIDAFRTADWLNLSHSFVHSVLENFVSDIAMLSLVPEEERKNKETELYERHQTFIERLFNALLVSRQWSANDAKFYTDLLSSPTIDASDQMLIVSAITLSTMTIYDVKKFSTLVNVYRHAQEEKVRQRALVGCVLSLTDDPLFVKEQASLMDGLITNEDMKRELLNLQKQMFNCMDAERDNDKIQRDIMPNIMKNSDLQFNRFGITEKEGDPLENILHPDADERKMEMMEESIQKMMKMQQQGSDIYFGGFSKMKRFPFFDHIANWFMPFSAHHPGLKEVAQKLGDSSVLDKMTEQGLFCESDKYSLALTIAQIINQLPANILEVIKSGDGIVLPVSEPSDYTPDFLRRLYIQDLYRFFEVKLAFNKDIANPFKKSGSYKAFFMMHDLFVKETYIEPKMSLSMFLHKHKREDDLDEILELFYSETATYQVFMGLKAEREGHKNEALEHFLRAIGTEPDNTWVLKTAGAFALKRKDYGLGLHCYGRLCELLPDVKPYAINYCLCLIATGDTKTALNKAYELDLSDETDNRIKRLLAWTLICNGNGEKALHIYNALTETDPLPDDALNIAYAHWVNGNPSEAKNYFVQWRINHPDAKLEEEFDNDSYMFEQNGITEVDKILMLSALKT